MAKRIKTGALVRFMDTENAHRMLPQVYPERGTLGRVLYASTCNPQALVEWPKGSTQLSGPWSVNTAWLDPVGWREKIRRRKETQANATK